MTTIWRHWWQLIFLAWNLYQICHITNSFYMRLMHVEDERPPNEKLHAHHLALLTTGVIFAYWPLLQFLLSPNAYLKDGVCKFVVSCA